MRRALRLGAALLLVALVALAAGAAWLRSRDPLAALPRRAESPLAVIEERRERWAGRTLLHLTLEDASVGRIRFAVSLPDPVPDRPLPTVMILGGLRGGSESIREISRIFPDPGPNALVGYDWPLPRRLPGGFELARRLPALRGQVLSVPGQVDAILRWAAEQPWSDGGRVSLLGFSLGGFVAPAAQRLAEARGARVGWTVLGYAGAPIGAVVAGHPGAGPAWLRPFLGAAVDVLLHPVEPSHHLPHLGGTFLVLGTRSDRLISAGAGERMAELTPEPRTVVLLEGDHLGVGAGKRRLLAEVMDVSRAWLVAQGAIDPGSAAGPAGTRRRPVSSGADGALGD